jgi:hypothetical protein
MYVEFELPTSGTHATVNAIRIAIARWASQYEIPLTGYSEKTIKYTHRLGFNREEYFSLFSMTWNEHFEFRIVNISNERY